MTDTPSLPTGSPLQPFHKAVWILLLLLALGMSAVSVYLVAHYYESHFPTSLTQAALCNLSSFWNCDLAVFSPISNFYHIPLAALGVIMGISLCLALFLRRPRWLETIYFLIIGNLVGCIGLLIYSLFYLQGLCPGCTIYYALSLVVFCVFIWAEIPFRRPSLQPLATYGALAVVLLGGLHIYNQERFLKQSQTAKGFVEKIMASPSYPEDAMDTGFYLASSAEEFMKKPLRMIVFSDFQCSVCKIFSEMLPRILAQYQDKIAIRYVFYPLDQQCNVNMKQAGHPQACSAAYLGYCSKSRFHEMHDFLYLSQGQFSDAFFQQLAVSSHLEACYRSEETHEAIRSLIAQSDATYQIDATPTLIINGKKFDGLLPIPYMFEIFDAILGKN